MATGQRFINATAVISPLIGGAVMAAGAASWQLITRQLKAERITVTDDAALLAGKPVRGPLSAYGQAEVIQQHALQGSDGLTYADLAEKAYAASEAGDTQQAEKWQQASETAMHAAFLRSSLYTSVLAYGVSALSIAVGALQVANGFALRKLSQR